MVRVEFGGQKILEIPGVEVPERNIGSQTTIRRSFTNSNGNTERSGIGTMSFGWNNAQPRLCVTSDTEDFDEEILAFFKEEGFQVSYLPYKGNHTAYDKKLQHLADSLELGESYAIVAYGDAAALVLESAMRPTPKLCAIIAYYPPYMPKTSADFPRTLNLVIHLASSQTFGTKHQRTFRYPDTNSGFAESDLEEYDKSAARLAWSRTLTTLRNGFGVQADLEAVWDHHLQIRDRDGPADNVDSLLKTMTLDASVDHVPTMTGGVGKKRLKRFYTEFFTDSRPKDFKSKLLSRTVGTDRLVDELLISFTHNTEVHWMLPGIPPTGKEIEIAVVVIIGVRGGKICAENVHWDQASVLFQIGLLDPTYIPDSFKTKESGKEKEVKQLPILGAEAAHKAADEDDGRSNKLIPGW